MAGRIICLLFLLLPGLFIQAKAQSFDKAAFYKVMENGNTDEVDKQLKIIETTSNINKEAYSGALLMKKAGLINGASKKLSVFKNGRAKLEAAIEKEKDNGEWHFLRLIIQENAPKILNYKSDKKDDAAMVHSAYKKLSPEVQSAVMDYRKHSDTLQTFIF
ncbi:MAG: hypothetical protein ABI402_00945 [Ferruginibacter sp.]